MIELLGSHNTRVDDIVIDSKAVLPGTLFVALKGTAKDGHDYIDEAIQRGAAAVLMQGPLPEARRVSAPQVTFIEVSNTKEALRHLVPYFFDYPAEKLQIIGITGTNGKTTTAYLIDALLTQAGKSTGLLGTIVHRLGGRTLKAKNTTPGLLDLQRNFSEMQQQGITHVVMEVSSHALDQGRVAGCLFSTAVFTNLTQDHLDYHQNMTAYFKAKKTLFYQCKGKWIINVDDPWGEQLARESPQKVWAYGIDKKKDLYPLEWKSSLDGLSMNVHTPIGEIEINAHLVGRHNVCNILAAIGAAISEGLSKPEIAAGIYALKNVPGRFERIDAGQDFTVIVDYAHTPDALERLLQTVSALSPKRVLTLFGCGGDRDRGKRPQMGAVAAALSDKVILTSDNPRSESPLEIIKEIEAGLLSSGKKHGSSRHGEAGQTDYEILPDRREAIQRIIDLAETGDLVVIAGKGHETDQQVGNIIIPFDDREMACQALAQKKQGGEPLKPAGSQS